MGGGGGGGKGGEGGGGEGLKRDLSFKSTGCGLGRVDKRERG